MNKAASLIASSLAIVLACCGFVSGLVSVFYVLNFESRSSAFEFAVFGSLTLALTLAAALWALGFVHSWTTLTAFAVATVAAHVICLAAPGQKTFSDHGTNGVPNVADYFVIAFTVCAVPLLMQLRGYQKWRALPIGLYCAGLAALVFTLTTTVGGIVVYVWNPFPLLLAWQTLLGCFLGVAMSRAAIESRPQPRPYAVGSVLLAYIIAFGAYTLVGSAIESKRIQERNARWRIEIAQRMANARSPQSLPALTRQPLERVLLMEPIGGCRPSDPKSEESSVAEQRGADLLVPPPARWVYEVAYQCTGSTPDDFTRVVVKATEYPTAAWAAFDIMNGHTPDELTRSSRFGQTVYVGYFGDVFSWPSGKMLLTISGVPQRPIPDALFKAYLTKYPSAE